MECLKKLNQKSIEYHERPTEKFCFLLNALNDLSTKNAVNIFIEINFKTPEK